MDSIRLYFRSVTFVVLSADQKVGAAMARSNNRGRIAMFVKEIISHFV